MAHSQLPVLVIHAIQRLLMPSQKERAQAEYTNLLCEEIRREERVKILPFASKWSAVDNDARFFPAIGDIYPKEEDRWAEQHRNDPGMPEGDNRAD